MYMSTINPRKIRVLETNIEKGQENKVYEAIRNQDPREMLSTCKMPTKEQHQSMIATPLKRIKPLSEEDLALEICKWVDVEESCR